LRKLRTKLNNIKAGEGGTISAKEKTSLSKRVDRAIAMREAQEFRGESRRAMADVREDYAQGIDYRVEELDAEGVVLPSGRERPLTPRERAARVKQFEAEGSPMRAMAQELREEGKRKGIRGYKKGGVVPKKNKSKPKTKWLFGFKK